MHPFLYPPPVIEQPVVIAEDNGGIVAEYQRAAAQYNNENRRVEIRGACRSACILALGVKNVCVGKGAYIQWHHAFDTYTHEPLYFVTQKMLEQIPYKIAQKVRPYISIKYNPQASLSYSQLLQLGIPDCDGYKPAVTATITLLQTRSAGQQVSDALTVNRSPSVPTSYAFNEAATEDPTKVKKREFDQAYDDALSISQLQNGAPATERNCDRSHCEDIVAYYDKHRRYVELHRSVDGEKRAICRLIREGIFEDSYRCTDWITGTTSDFHWQREVLF